MLKEDNCPAKCVFCDKNGKLQESSDKTFLIKLRNAAYIELKHNHELYRIAAANF